MRSLAIALVLTGCAEDTCSRSDRTGTFLADWYELSGDCGPVPAAIVTIDSPIALPASCEFDSPDSWSEDSCTLNRAYSCPNDGSTYSFSAETEQWPDDPDYIFGTVILTVTGALACQSVYDVDWTRT